VATGDREGIIENFPSIFPSSHFLILFAVLMSLK